MPLRGFSSLFSSSFFSSACWSAAGAVGVCAAAGAGGVGATGACATGVTAGATGSGAGAVDFAPRSPTHATAASVVAMSTPSAPNERRRAQASVMAAHDRSSATSHNHAEAEAGSLERERTLRFTVVRFLRPYFGRLLLVLAILGLNAFLGLLNPWLVQQLFDRVLLARRLDLLWWFGAVFVSVAVVRFAIEFVQAQTYTRVSTRVLLDMQRDFLAHLARLSLRFFAGARFGDLMTRFNRDLGQIQQFATGLLPGLVTSLFTLVGALAWGLWYGADLFLIACAPLPIALLVARLFRKRVETQTRHLRELSAKVTNTVTETLTGIRTVRSFGRERGEVARFVRRSHEFLRASLGFQRTNSLASGLPRMCLVASSVIIYSVGGARVIRGEMQLGALLALSMYVAMAFGPLLSLADFYLQLVQTRVSLERVRELRDMPLETPEDPATPRPLPVVGAIRFDDVHFRHSEREPLLEGVSFSVAPGETVALVGPSGAGKSTLIDLLFRFVDPQRGRVEIDGQDLRRVQVARIRREMAVVSQDVFLFHDSVFE